MAILIDLLSHNLAYDSSWAIYAEKIEGKFAPYSPARIGQRIFENGGLLDDCEFFASLDQIEDRRTDWIGGYEDYDNDFDFKDLYEEAGEQLIDELNQLVVEA